MFTNYGMLLYCNFYTDAVNVKEAY